MKVRLLIDNQDQLNLCLSYKLKFNNYFKQGTLGTIKINIKEDYSSIEIEGNRSLIAESLNTYPDLKLLKPIDYLTGLNGKGYKYGSISWHESVFDVIKRTKDRNEILNWLMAFPIVNPEQVEAAKYVKNRFKTYLLLSNNDAKIKLSKNDYMFYFVLKKLTSHV